MNRFTGGSVRGYLGMLRMKLIAGMQYRAAAWAGVATQFFWGFMYIMIYRAFYRSSSAAPPMEWRQLVCYAWLRQAFFAFISQWYVDNDLLAGIRDGQVAYELCRPYDLYGFWFARLVGTRAANAALRCLPILIIASLLPSAYRMSLPPRLGASALFLLSLILALALVTAISMFIYILTFVTLTPAGARLIISVAADFLSGHLLPVPLMPERLQVFVNFFPFRYTSDLPFRLYSGNIVGGEAMFQIGVQLAWIFGLILLGKHSRSGARRAASSCRGDKVWFTSNI
jgi:ABC-2 type transport system permease protein